MAEPSPEHQTLHPLSDSLEPYYDMQVAASLIPYPYNNLKWYLSQNAHGRTLPKRYRRTGVSRRKVRLLSLTEVLDIRKKVLTYG